MAEDGRASGVQSHAEINPTSTGYATGVQSHAEINPASTGYATGVQSHADFHVIPVGYTSGVVMMVEYNDSPLVAAPIPNQGYNTVGRRSRRIQGGRFRRRVGQWVPKKPTTNG